MSLNRKKVKDCFFIELDYKNNNDEFYVMLYWFAVISLFVFAFVFGIVVNLVNG